MAAWHIFTGTGDPGRKVDAWRALPDAPPWRDRATAVNRFVIGPELLDAVNTALHLRRPLLLTGAPGSGKSTLVARIAAELQLGEALEWHITSRSTITDGLYQYDALGRLHATQAHEATGTEVERFVTLGPLGTALAARDRPRAVLIDEIDKSDFDLPSDLLTVLEQGEFDIPPLVRDAGTAHRVRGADRAVYDVTGGVVRRTHWPVIVFTSNGERTFPAPFLRRCVRFEMPTATETFIRDVVAGHLPGVEATHREEIHRFAQRLVEGDNLALDQLLNFLHLVSGEPAPDGDTRERVGRILLEELNGK